MSDGIGSAPLPMVREGNGRGKREAGGAGRPRQPKVDLRPKVDLKEAAWGLAFRVALGMIAAVAATVAQHGSVCEGVVKRGEPERGPVTHVHARAQDDV